MGQTGRSFRTRFKVHLRDFKHGNRKSSFAKHLLENGHAIGPIEDIMSTIYITNKDRLMDTLEKYYIFRETKIDNQVNDKVAVRPNVIFETTVQKRSPQRDTQHSPHGMNSPHLSRTRAISVNTQTTTATFPPGINHFQPPHPAVHHETSFHILNYNPKNYRVRNHT